MIRFNQDVGTLKTVPIRGEGFDPFEVTYALPGAGDALSADILACRESGGKAALWLAARCLRSWSLTPALPADEEARAKLLDGMDPPAALLAIYLELREAGRESLKNS